MKLKNQFFEIKENYMGFWYKARCSLIRRLIECYAANNELEILDVGCADGYIRNTLWYYKNYDGNDIINDYSYLFRNFYLGDICNLKIQKKYDVIIALEIMEHLPDDKAFMQKLSSLLNEGGYIFLSIPAFQYLFGNHDKMLKHYRRYDKKSMEVLVKNTKELSIKQISYWGRILYPIALLTKRTRRVKKNTPIIDNFFLLALLRDNSKIIREDKVNFGTSMIVVLKKNGINKNFKEKKLPHWSDEMF